MPLSVNWYISSKCKLYLICHKQVMFHSSTVQFSDNLGGVFARWYPCVNSYLAAENYTPDSLVTVDLSGSRCDLMEVLCEASLRVLMLSHRALSALHHHYVRAEAHTSAQTLCLNAPTLNKHHHFSVRCDINGCRGRMHFGGAITLCAVHFLLAGAWLHFLRVTPRSMKYNSCSRSPNQN